MSDDRARWDPRYRAAIESGTADRAPADLLLENAALLDGQPRGRALDVACGLGRNALHLAALGFAVDAVDVSPVALAHVAGRNAAIATHCLDLTTQPLPGSGYEVIVNTYFLARRLFGPLAAALAPGGLLLFETFLPDPAATYGPQDADRVLAPGELREAFAQLDVLAYREGARDAASRAVAGLVARRRPLA